jgi:hypothetical protein
MAEGNSMNLLERYQRWKRRRYYAKYNVFEFRKMVLRAIRVRRTIAAALERGVDAMDPRVTRLLDRVKDIGAAADPSCTPEGLLSICTDIHTFGCNYAREKFISLVCSCRSRGLAKKARRALKKSDPVHAIWQLLFHHQDRFAEYGCGGSGGDPTNECGCLPKGLRETIIRTLVFYDPILKER